MNDPLMTHLLQQSIEHNDPLADPATGKLIVRLLQRSIEQNGQILDEHNTFKASLASHILNEETLVKGLINAFPKKPDGSPDFEGHEMFHTTLIEESRARTVFYRELQHELIKKSLWGIVLVLGALITYWWTGQVRGH